MHSEFKIIPYLDEQYIITTGSQCYLSFLKIICAATLICCDVRSDIVGSPGSCGGRRR